MTLSMIKPHSGASHSGTCGHLVLTDGDNSTPHGFPTYTMEISFFLSSIFILFLEKTIEVSLPLILTRGLCKLGANRESWDQN